VVDAVEDVVAESDDEELKDSEAVPERDKEVVVVAVVDAGASDIDAAVELGVAIGLDGAGGDGTTLSDSASGTNGATLGSINGAFSASISAPGRMELTIGALAPLVHAKAAAIEKHVTKTTTQGPSRRLAATRLARQPLTPRKSWGENAACNGVSGPREGKDRSAIHARSL
jgi:hypothetical protein